MNWVNNLRSEKERRLFLDKRRERIYNKGKDIVGKDMDDGTV
jgi:hypothetical protein